LYALREMASALDLASKPRHVRRSERKNRQLPPPEPTNDMALLQARMEIIQGSFRMLLALQYIGLMSAPTEAAAKSIASRFAVRIQTLISSYRLPHELNFADFLQSTAMAVTGKDQSDTNMGLQQIVLNSIESMNRTGFFLDQVGKRSMADGRTRRDVQQMRRVILSNILVLKQLAAGSIDQTSATASASLKYHPNLITVALGKKKEAEKDEGEQIAAAGAHGVGDGKDASRRHRVSDGRDAPMVGQGSTPLVQVDEYPAPSLFSAASSLGPDQNPDLYSLSPDTLGQSSYRTAPASTTATHSATTQHLLLQHAMGLTIDILVTYGVSPEGIDLLRAHGLETVSDLGTLDTHSLAHQGYSREDIDTLTRLAIEVGHESTNERLQRMQEQQRNVNGLGEDRFLPIKNTFINFPPSQLTACKKTPQSCPVDMSMTLPKSFTTTVGNESNLSPVASSQSPESTPIDLDLSVYPSIGSRLHASGTCKPCAWFYHASGCRHGAQCEFCHLCRVELKIRLSGITQVEVMEWHVKPGDEIEEMDRLCTVESDKAAVDITSRYGGTVKRLLFDVNSIAKVGDVLLEIEEGEPDGVEETPAKESSDRVSGKEETSEALAAPTQTSGPIVPFHLADIGEGISEVAIMEWHVEEGDRVEEMDRLCTVESDKAVVDITSRYNGVIRRLGYKVGDTAKVGSVLVDMEVERLDGEEGQPVAAGKVEQPEVVEKGSELSRGSKAEGRALAIPMVRQAAKEKGIDINSVLGTGPDGRIVMEDILQAAEAATKVDEVAPAEKAQDTSESYRVSLTRGVAAAMVKSMTASLAAPHMNLGEEIRVDELLRVQANLKKLVQGPPHNLPSITLTAIMVKALSLSLHKHETLNSKIDPSGEFFTVYRHHNISMAVDSPSGLVVPNVKGVEKKSLVQIQKDILEIQ
ncbi:hypothetical protein FOZ63_029928, partial [Perkinsus olseni]